MISLSEANCLVTYRKLKKLFSNYVFTLISASDVLPTEVLLTAGVSTSHVKLTCHVAACGSGQDAELHCQTF